MTELTLTLYFLVGAPVTSPISLHECIQMHAEARYTDATGGLIVHDSQRVVTALECAGLRIDMTPPSGADHCEVGPSS
jgi:hypothetical protein